HFKMGEHSGYVLIFILLCLLTQFQASQAPGILMSWYQMLSEGFDTELRNPYDIELGVIDIRSDGVRFEWNLTGAWYDEYNFNVSLTSLRNNSWTPWPNNCSENYNCMKSPCQIDTKNIGTCESVEGCQTAIVTVTGSGIHEDQSSANIEIVTGPSSGKIVKGITTPDYTPSISLQTDSDGTVIVFWHSPPLTSRSRCAEKALIKTRVDGKANNNRDIIQHVDFSRVNKVMIRPDGLSHDKESEVEITVAYMVRVNGVYKATDIKGSASVITRLGGG
ncbi:unnamed protein product, partial [Meganyctiphanes norvegica]